MEPQEQAEHRAAAWARLNFLVVQAEQIIPAANREAAAAVQPAQEVMEAQVTREMVAPATRLPAAAAAERMEEVTGRLVLQAVGAGPEPTAAEAAEAG